MVRVERHGFNGLAGEADWPDAARIDDYVRHQAPRPRRGDVFARFPTWMWRNQEVLQFADWLRGHNASLARSEEHTSELQSLMRISYAVFCLKKKKTKTKNIKQETNYTTKHTLSRQQSTTHHNSKEIFVQPQRNHKQYT